MDSTQATHLRAYCNTLQLRSEYWASANKPSVGRPEASQLQCHQLAINLSIFMGSAALLGSVEDTIPPQVHQVGSFSEPNTRTAKHFTSPAKRAPSLELTFSVMRLFLVKWQAWAKS